MAHHRQRRMSVEKLMALLQRADPKADVYVRWNEGTIESFQTYALPVEHAEDDGYRVVLSFDMSDL